MPTSRRGVFYVLLSRFVSICPLTGLGIQCPLYTMLCFARRGTIFLHCALTKRVLVVCSRPVVNAACSCLFIRVWLNIRARE
jgi:hypothetical protein